MIISKQTPPDCNQTSSEILDHTIQSNARLSERSGTHDDLFQVLVEAVTDYAIYMLDPLGTVITWNTGAAKSKGYAAEEILGKNYRCFFTPEDIASGLPESQLELARLHGRYEGEGWRLRKDGSPFWANVVLTPIFTPDGSLRGFAKVTRDLTEMKAKEEALHASEVTLQQEEERLRVTLGSIGEGVIAADSNGVVVIMNPAAERITGWAAQDAIGKPIEQVLACQDIESGQIVNCLRTALVSGISLSTNANHLVLKNPEGDECVIRCYVAALQPSAAQAGGGVLVLQDVTKERESQRILEFQATHDMLTGVRNRSSFEAQLVNSITQSQSSKQTHTLCYVDLDHFKEVNDTGGHAAGDALLKQVALLLRRMVRHTDEIARLGGDEFALLLYGCTHTRALQITNNLMASIRDCVPELNRDSTRISASIGVISFNGSLYGAVELIEKADSACYEAKRAGRNSIRFHSDSTIS